MTKKNTVNILVTLKIFDNVAASALYALRDRLRCEQIQSLDRSDYWSIQLYDLDEKTAVERIEQVVSRTALFANPNKHRWSIHSNASLVDLLPEKREGSVAAILVEDEDDAGAAELRETLIQRGDLGKRIEVLHGIWWVLHLGNLCPEAARTIAEEIAVTRGRRQGLLCNPHYQRATVLVPERP